LLLSNCVRCLIFFVYLVSVLIQHHFTCYHLVIKFLTQRAYGVQALCVVDVDLDRTSDALTAVSVQLDSTTTSMACMALVVCVQQVS